MGLIDVHDLKKEFQGEVLFEHVSFSLNRQDKLAIIGNNGVGKTTLLNIILGKIHEDGGSVQVASDTSVGYLSQVMIQSFDNTLFQEMLLAFQEVTTLEKQLVEITSLLATHSHDPELLKKYGRVETLFLAKGGYDYHYLIDLMISKFGFSKEDYQRPINTFSGGERNKIAFSKLLLNHPDVLILDEPTNHLDMATIQWLEDYLRAYDGAVLIVSHDRYFIDSVCNAVYEIASQTGEWYRGNYSYYLAEKVMRYEQRLKAYQLQESEIEKLHMLIQKFKPKPTKASFAKDREKKLERILVNRMDKPTVYKKQMKINLTAKIERRVRQMTLLDVVYGHEELALSSAVNIEIFNGDKLAIIGDNGVGKTTLLKTIAEMIPIISGELRQHRKLNIGYIDQNQIQISSQETVFDYFHNRYPQMNHYEIRSHLGSFLFSGEDVDKRIDYLSGGEKIRLSFALLLLQKYDILLLDEPTNHLDIDTKKVLESTLATYAGTIIFVSHDRYFVDELATRVLVIEKQEATLYEGDYQYYLAMQNKNQTPISLTTEKKNQGKDTTKRLEKFDRKKVEDRINHLEQEISNLHTRYEQEEYVTDPLKMRIIDREIEEKEKELQPLIQLYFENIDK